MSRSEYLYLPNKSQSGRPSQFFYNRQTTPEITLWPTPDSSSDSIVYYNVQRIEDADASVNTTDAPFRFLPCMVAGLAYYLAMKKAPERVQLLKAVYEEEFQRAADEDEDRLLREASTEHAVFEGELMARFASGKDAWGYSDRSGFRYRLTDMVTEWNGLLVGRDEYEPKHPQLEPIRCWAGSTGDSRSAPSMTACLSPYVPNIQLVTVQWYSRA